MFRWTFKILILALLEWLNLSHYLNGLEMWLAMMMVWLIGNSSFCFNEIFCVVGVQICTNIFFRYLIWIVSTNSKPVIDKEKIKLPLDWPTQCILMATKYHLSNKNKQYNIHPELYAKVYELERKSTRLHEKQWTGFLQLLSEGEEEAALLSRKKSPIVPAARYVNRIWCIFFIFCILSILVFWNCTSFWAECTCRFKSNS